MVTKGIYLKLFKPLIHVLQLVIHPPKAFGVLREGN